MRYLVVIPYHEPTYRPSASGERGPYRASYEVAAGDPAQAKARALERFEGDASESGVGWIREPLEDRIEVTPVTRSPVR